MGAVVGGRGRYNGVGVEFGGVEFGVEFGDAVVVWCGVVWVGYTW